MFLLGSSIFSLFSIKDLLDLLLVATLLFYLYRTMKDSGSLDIFVGVLAFGEPMRAGVLLGLGCILLCVFILK